MSKEFRFAGFRITMDPLLPVVIVLIGWLLSERYFPTFTFTIYDLNNYMLGGIASLLLTFSILFHELGHALAAKKMHLQIEKIHLLLFGGMAELKHRPNTPRQELMVALAGPLASFLLAFFVWMLNVLVEPYNEFLSLILMFTAQMNFLLGLFNLIPIFPLDGGRALRAVLWTWQKRFSEASGATLTWSYIIVIIIIILAVLDYLYYQSGYTVILITLALYLVYTIYTGRKELRHRPDVDELIYQLDEDPGIEVIMNKITETNPEYLKRTIFPLLDGDHLAYVVHGKHLKDLAAAHSMDYSSVQKVPGIGDYIEISDPETWNHGLRFNADFVSVLDGGMFQGMCDANELRFWLLEHQSGRDPHYLKQLKRQTGHVPQ